MLEQSIKATQDSYDREIEMYNERIEYLRKKIEDAERSLDKFTSECRHLAMYQTSLENELERYKRIIENEDNRLISEMHTDIWSPTIYFRQGNNVKTNKILFSQKAILFHLNKNFIVF